MYNAQSTQTVCRARMAAAALLVSLSAAGMSMSSPAAGEDALARDLTVEQTAVFSVQASSPAAGSADALHVVAWVDHADNTYAVGEAVRLFVRANGDSYLTVLNVGPSGNVTLLFPNTGQRDARIKANEVVEIPAAGTSIRASGPVGAELIKVVASTSPVPLFDAAALVGAGPFATLSGGSRSAARDLQVTMDDAASHEWDDYNKVIRTIASRPAIAVPLAPAPPEAGWPVPSSGLRLAVDKQWYQVGEPVSIFVSSDTPCYLTLVNTGSSGVSRVLVPNAAQPQNFLPAGQVVVFPGGGSNLSLTPVGPEGIETVTAICSADNQPVLGGSLSYGGSGFATLGSGASPSRDLSIVVTSPARQAAHATVGFLVTQ